MSRSLSLLLASTAILLAAPAYANHGAALTTAQDVFTASPLLQNASTAQRRGEVEARGREAEGEAPRGQNGADDGPTHDAGDDHGGNNGGDDAEDHDAGDDHGDDSSDDSSSDDSSDDSSSDDSNDDSSSDDSSDDSSSDDSSDDSSSDDSGSDD